MTNAAPQVTSLGFEAVLRRETTVNAAHSHRPACNPFAAPQDVVYDGLN